MENNEEIKNEEIQKEEVEKIEDVKQENRKCNFALIKNLLIVNTILSVLILGCVGTFAYTSISYQIQVAKAEKAKNMKISQTYDTNPADLDTVLNDNKPAIVFFYADWCGYCRKFVPTFDKLTKDKTLTDKYNLVYVNCEAPQNAKYVEEYGIHAFPTLYVIDKEKDTKIHVANQILFTEDALEVVKKQFIDYFENGVEAITASAE